MVPHFYIVISPNKALVTAPRMWRMHLIPDPGFLIISNEILKSLIRKWLASDMAKSWLYEMEARLTVALTAE